MWGETQGYANEKYAVTQICFTFAFGHTDIL